MFKISKKSQIILLTIAFIFFIVGLFLHYEFLQSRVVIKKYRGNQVVAEKKQNEDNITVYVCGEVNSPGVYVICAGSRVKDALAAANGVNASADLNKINLAARLFDEDRIYVPVKKKARDKKPSQSKKNTKTSKQKSRYKHDYGSGSNQAVSAGADTPAGEGASADKNAPAGENSYTDENNLLIDQGIVEIKVNGKVQK